MSVLFRIFALLLVVSGVFSLCLAPAKTAAAPTVAEAEVPAPAAPPPATNALAMAVLDPDSGALLAGKNENARRPMASTTKIMTALVVLETLPLTATVTVPAEAVGVEGSSVYLYAGERITVETLLYALLLSSANDAATALAIACAGSVADFAARMNEKAAALGLSDTHFENPHGLPAEGHYTTAQELARLTAAALQNETFAAIVATARYEAPENEAGAVRLFVNHNRLLRTYEGAIGVKTGFTRAAGRCLVSAAAREGLRLVVVTLGDGNDWADHKALFDWGFANFARFTAAVPAVQVPVVGGERCEVALTPAGEASLLLPAAHGEITCRIEAPRFLYGGCRAGEVLGRAIYYMDGKVLCTLPLCAAQTVAEKRPPTLWQRIKDHVK